MQRSSHRYNLILKARQFGFTTLYCIDLLDEALWVPGTTCAIIGHERESLDKIFEIIKRAHANLPEMLRPQTKTDTIRALQFTTMYTGTPLDSGIYVALKLRSGTVQRLHITESAYIKNRQELIAGSKQAVPITGSISEETTGNGFNEFYDSYMRASQNPAPAEHEYKSYFYPWYLEKQYTLDGLLAEPTATELSLKAQGVTDGQLLWRRWKMKDLMTSQEGIGLTGDQLFKQEYPSTVAEAFQSGIGAVFNNDLIDRIVQLPPLTAQQALEAIEPPGSNGDYLPEKIENIERVKALNALGVKFWKLPEVDVEYVVGGDPSDGVEGDNGVLCVMRKDNAEQVAEFVGNVRPDELAQVAAMLGYLYNEAYVGIENNMIACVLFLSKIYSRYHYESKVDQKTQTRTKTLGWNTNSITRDLLIDEFIIRFEESTTTIRSGRVISEMKTFIKNNKGKREHAPGKTDDALFAYMIAIQMIRAFRSKAKVYTKNYV